jgi:hypothetical protein
MLFSMFLRFRSSLQVRPNVYPEEYAANEVSRNLSSLERLRRSTRLTAALALLLFFFSLGSCFPTTAYKHQGGTYHFTFTHSPHPRPYQPNRKRKEASQLYLGEAGFSGT